MDPFPFRKPRPGRRDGTAGVALPSFRASEVIIHPDHVAAYDRLAAEAAEGKKPQAAIWKTLQAAFLRAKASAQFADPIPRARIPRCFSDKYRLENLYCVDLANFWRGFYTIEGRRVIFLDVVDHARYDEWFPNKGK